MPVAMAMPAIAAWRFARPDTIFRRFFAYISCFPRVLALRQRCAAIAAAAAIFRAQAVRNDCSPTNCTLMVQYCGLRATRPNSGLA